MTVSGLRWRAQRTPAISPDDREVWLFGGDGPVRLAGTNAGPLARSIDGLLDAEQVVTRAVQLGMDRATAERLLKRWMEAGHVVDSEVEPTPSVRAHVIGAPQEFEAALRGGGIETVSADADVIVSVVDDLLALESLDLDYGVPMIAVQLRGERALVTTPLASGAGCAACLSRRMAVRRSMDLVAARRSGRDFPPPSEVMHASALPVAAGIVAAQLTTSSEEHEQEQGVFVITPTVGTVERHRVVQVPGCPRCDPSGSSSVNAHLDDVIAHETDTLVDGAGLVGFRTRDPEETWQAHAHHISQIVGVVPVVELNGPMAMRSFVAGANVVGIDDPAIAASLFRNRGGGKGLTLSAARASALAEALERDALRTRGDEGSQLARFAELEGAIHPHDVQLFSTRQMQMSAVARLTGSASGGSGHPVPVPFAEDKEHAWSPVRSLVSDQIHWLPTSMLYIGWAPRGSGLPPACSNGSAAGNTRAEAQLQGLLELVERDAVALWWYPRSRRTRFDVDSWDDPRVQSALAPHRAAGSRIDVIDITSDLGVPCAAALITDRHSGLILTGAGAHTDPAIAVARALTEAAQMVAAVTGVDVDDPHFREYANSSWDSRLSEADRDWVFGVGVSDIPAAPSYASVIDARDDVVARVNSRGIDVLWADMTRRDVDLPVVRTFAPGLRHFWRRLAPGRLYDVPLAQGWITEPLDEASVNPLEMPI